MAANVAIIGGATLVGSEIKTLLQNASFDLGDVKLLTASEPDDPGLHARLTDFEGEAVVETPVSGSDLEDVELVFLCERGTSHHPALAAARRIIDLTLDPGAPGPLVVSGVNDALIGKGTRIRSPHSATILLSHLLWAVAPLAPRRIVATVLMGASDAGRPGIDELMAQTRATLSFRSVPHEVFAQQIAFNLLPPFQGEGRIETVIGEELREILGVEASVALVRVPIFYGVCAAVHLEVEAPHGKVMDALRSHAVLSLRTDEDASPVGIVGEDRVSVGSLTEDAPGSCWIWALCDNARRGGALNAVEIAEKALAASA